jgi:hypothetical protein
MMAIFVGIFYIYFELENDSNLKNTIRRSFCTRRGRALIQLTSYASSLKEQEKQELIKELEIIKMLNKLGVHSALKKIENVKIKFYNFWGLKINEDSGRDDFFDDLFYGIPNEVVRDLEFALEMMGKTNIKQ